MRIRAAIRARRGYDITQLGFPPRWRRRKSIRRCPTSIFDDVGGGVGGTANWDTFMYASENNDASATLTKMKGNHELSAGFEYMKRFLNVGQPPAPSGAYNFDISATDQSVDSGVGGSDFASFLIGMGETPGSESYNFTKDLFVAEANPYYAAFVQDTWHATQDLHPHGRAAVGHLRRADGAA